MTKVGFTLSLIAGLLLILFSIPYAVSGLSGILTIITGLSLGILLLICSVLLYKRPQEHMSSGVSIVVFSLINMFASLYIPAVLPDLPQAAPMGSLTLTVFMIASIIGIVGGVFGIAKK